MSFIWKIADQLEAIAREPLLYRLRPEIGDAARLATVIRYVILFRVIGEKVRVERVVHGGRDLAALLDDDSPAQAGAATQAPERKMLLRSTSCSAR